MVQGSAAARKGEILRTKEDTLDELPRQFLQTREKPLVRFLGLGFLITLCGSVPCSAQGSSTPLTAVAQGCQLHVEERNAIAIRLVVLAKAVRNK